MINYDKLQKAGIITIGLVVSIFLMMVIYQNISDHIPEDWPDRDKMEENLTKKGYEVTVSDSIILDGSISYEGSRITAVKGTYFVDAFWYVDNNALEVIEKYIKTHYDDGAYHRVGNTIYFGTEKALKQAGVNIRKS